VSAESEIGPSTASTGALRVGQVQTKLFSNGASFACARQRDYVWYVWKKSDDGKITFKQL
jgi:hypothetical protein